VASTAPTGGQSLTWNAGTSKWEPSTPAAGGVSAARNIATGGGLQGGGDLSADRTLSLKVNSNAGLVSNLGTGTDELGLNVDGTTVELNANALRVKDGGIGDAKLASGISASKFRATSRAMQRT